MNHGSLWTRWRAGVSWMWVAPPFESYLRDRDQAAVMNLETRDRYHAKQGRSTARVVLRSDRPDSRGPLAVYLKRHYRLSTRERMLALFDPAGPHTPAAAERRNLERAAALGVPVPEVVAAGGRTGPRGRLESFLMIAELRSSAALNEILPTLVTHMGKSRFDKLKRALARELARITATLHSAGMFHSDLYLCHFFLERAGEGDPSDRPRLALIDLHRAVEPRFGRFWRRWKDLGQLLYSTHEVACVGDRDRLRFLVHYRRMTGVRGARFLAMLVQFRAARYEGHNQKRPRSAASAAPAHGVSTSAPSAAGGS